MPWVDQYETFPYHHQSWAKGSTWYFKRYRDAGDDDDIVVRVSGDSVVEYDEDAAVAARLSGKDYKATQRQTTKTSGLMAQIVNQSRGWEGPEFLLPSGFKDKFGNPHYLGGKLPPCTEEFIRMRPSEERREIGDFLNLLYKGASDEELARFREGGRAVARSAHPGRGASGDTVPA